MKMIKEAVVGGTLVYKNDDDEEKRLCLFQKKISVDTFYSFLDYRWLGDKEDIMKRNIMKPLNLGV